MVLERDDLLEVVEGELGEDGSGVVRVPYPPFFCALGLLLQAIC